MAAVVSAESGGKQMLLLVVVGVAVGVVVAAVGLLQVGTQADHSFLKQLFCKAEHYQQARPMEKYYKFSDKFKMYITRNVMISKVTSILRL